MSLMASWPGAKSRMSTRPGMTRPALRSALPIPTRIATALPAGQGSIVRHVKPGAGAASCVTRELRSP